MSKLSVMRILVIAFFILSVVNSKGQLNLIPLWQTNVSVACKDVDVNAVFVAVATDSSVKILDVATGVLRNEYRAQFGTIVGVRFGSNPKSVWIVEHKNVSGSPSLLVRSFDVETNDVQTFVQLKDDASLVGTYFDNVIVDISHNGEYVMCCYQYFRYPQRYESRIWVVSTHNAAVQSITVPAIGSCELSTIDDKIFLSGNDVTYYEYRGDSHFNYFPSTTVIDGVGDSLKIVASLSQKFRASESFSFVYDDDTVRDWPDLQVLPHSRIPIVSGSPLFSSDGMSYFHQVSASPFNLEYRDLDSNNLIAHAIDSSFGKGLRMWCSPMRHYLLVSDTNGRIKFWDLRGLPTGTPAMRTNVPSLITEMTFTKIAMPTVIPIGLKVEFEAVSNAEFFKDWWFLSKGKENCFVATKAILEDGIEFTDTSVISFYPLRHDYDAISYWNVADMMGAYMSENGRYVGIATERDVFRIDIPSDTINHVALQGSFSPIMFACDNSGAVFEVVNNLEYVNSGSVGGNACYVEGYRVNAIKIPMEGSIENTLTFTYQYDGGPESVYYQNVGLIRTNWIEGFGMLVAWYSNYRDYAEQVHLYNCRSGAKADTNDVCMIAPTAMDYHAPTKTFAMSGFNMPHKGASDSESKVFNEASYREVNGFCAKRTMAFRFNRMKFSSDGKFIVTNMGVFDTSMQPVESLILYGNRFVPIPGTNCGITFNKDTIIKWTVPVGDSSTRTVLHAPISTVQIDGSSSAVFVAFENGTMELFNLASLFNSPWVTSREDVEKSGQSIEIVAYPNPTTSTITITSPLLQVQGARITVFNALGSPLNQYSVSDSSGIQTIDLHDVLGVAVPGAYYVRVEADGKVQSIAVAVVGE